MTTCIQIKGQNKHFNSFFMLKDYFRLIATVKICWIGLLLQLILKITQSGLLLLIWTISIISSVSF